jgi:hypothetical protein
MPWLQFAGEADVKIDGSIVQPIEDIAPNCRRIRSGYGERSISSGKLSLPSFWASAIPFAALPNIQDIVGAAIADIAISIRARFAGASHVSEIKGTPRSVIHRLWD